MDNITYKLHTDSSGNVCSVSILGIPGKNISIPCDPRNTAYQEYLAWLAEGNTPEPADEPETP